jgi:glycerol uptake facilitator-like aquaporin
MLNFGAAAFNPMLGTTWYMFSRSKQLEFPTETDHFVVFWLAPFAGACLASFLYAMCKPSEFFFGYHLRPFKSPFLKRKVD